MKLQELNLDYESALSVEKEMCDLIDIRTELAVLRHRHRHEPSLIGVQNVAGSVPQYLNNRSSYFNEISEWKMLNEEMEKEWYFGLIVKPATTHFLNDVDEENDPECEIMRIEDRIQRIAKALNTMQQRMKVKNFKQDEDESNSSPHSVEEPISESTNQPFTELLRTPVSESASDQWKFSDHVEVYLQLIDAWLPGTIVTVRQLDKYDVFLESWDIVENVHACDLRPVCQPTNARKAKRVTFASDSLSERDISFDSDGETDDTFFSDVSTSDCATIERLRQNSSSLATSLRDSSVSSLPTYIYAKCTPVLAINNPLNEIRLTVLQDPWKVGACVEYFEPDQHSWVPGNITRVYPFASNVYDLQLQDGGVRQLVPVCRLRDSTITIDTGNFGSNDRIDRTETSDVKYESDFAGNSDCDSHVVVCSVEYESDYDDNSEPDIIAGIYTDETNSAVDSVTPDEILHEGDNGSFSTHTACDFQEGTLLDLDEPYPDSIEYTNQQCLAYYTLGDRVCIYLKRTDCAVTCTITYVYPSDSAFEYQYDVQLDNGDQILEVWSYQLHWSDTTEISSNLADQSSTNHTEGTEISIDNSSTTSKSVDPNYYKEESLNDRDVGNYVKVIDTRTGNWLHGVIIREFGDRLNYYDILYKNNDIEFDVPFYRLRSMPNIRTYSKGSVYGTYLNKLHSVSSSSAPLTAAETDIDTCHTTPCEETKSSTADSTTATSEKDATAKETQWVTRVEFLLFLTVLLLCRITTQL